MDPYQQQYPPATGYQQQYPPATGYQQQQQQQYPPPGTQFQQQHAGMYQQPAMDRFDHHGFQQPPAPAYTTGSRATAANIDVQVDPKMQHPPSFKLSNCQGRKRALLIGINYFGSKNELRGCINDVHNIKAFLLERFNFKQEDMVILTDDQQDSKFIPTKENIISACQWLVRDAQENDSFFLHYSGHGGQVADTAGDEVSGFDDTIYPVDFERYEGETGQITDDQLHDLLVNPLPKGCRLTALFDSCHSGTVLDLPYVYSTKGTVKSTQNMFKDAGMGLLSAGMAYATGDKNKAISSLMSMGKQIYQTKRTEMSNRENKSSDADVVMFSGCKDDQTSADASEAGKATGAMSYAFIRSFRENQEQTYLELLNNVRVILSDKYSQRPQFSSSHPLDMDLQFIC